VKPEIKISMEWEGYDKLFLDMLLEGYETTYWAFRDAQNDIMKDPVKYDFKREDVQDSLNVLSAFEILADHYTSRDDHVPLLKDIRDRMDAKAKIAKGMSNG
jgi:hypothetical protein